MGSLYTELPNRTSLQQLILTVLYHFCTKPSDNHKTPHWEQFMVSNSCVQKGGLWCFVVYKSHTVALLDIYSPNIAQKSVVYCGMEAHALKLLGVALLSLCHITAHKRVYAKLGFEGHNRMRVDGAPVKSSTTCMTVWPITSLSSHIDILHVWLICIFSVVFQLLPLWRTIGKQLTSENFCTICACFVFERRTEI